MPFLPISYDSFRLKQLQRLSFLHWFAESQNSKTLQNKTNKPCWLQQAIDWFEIRCRLCERPSVTTTPLTTRICISQICLHFFCFGIGNRAYAFTKSSQTRFQKPINFKDRFFSILSSILRRRQDTHLNLTCSSRISLTPLAWFVVVPPKRQAWATAERSDTQITKSNLIDTILSR